ncbi:cobalamin ABC transporter substrate-binding protein [Photobacterium kishitanii]|uniref:Cobalamin ABC transporter substrate-binding protein n=1 Tax=Photobacterium kishitanii TaxID=318456 RepID=A0A2T3KKS2_9GAMM|nr:ABC transporter substrate-binding protein [Photobacterium kishitanii]OBU27913.1 cobalamin ABC transporter substrate-binding protein [Photobacterium kishitanii]PSV00112.1 cobalamin ABC transporter substrate-binding protein [Photobacterium kishitanii]PSW71047.1 cobalamin ABC transporter substrate-binding protein [Photobacterium kishitanii]
MKTKLKILTLCAATLWSLPSFAATYPITVTDVAGRTITFNHPPQNIALSTSRIFPLLEIIYQQDAAKHLVAARNDMQVSAPSMYANYIKHYPSLKNVAKIGLIKSGEFDAERFINLKPKPDLFIVDLSNIKLAQDNGLLKKLAAAGIKVIAVDFRENPIKNTVRSVESVAKAVGREAQGQAFARYYLDHVAELQKKLAQYPNLKPKKVFIERAAGYSDSCCRTFAGGNMGAYIPFLKAINIADKPLDGAVTGQMSPETVITAHPDVYIMQTTGWVNDKGQPTHGIPLGYNPNPAAIKAATSALMDRDWLQAVSAYQTKNVYSIYMPFYNSPYNLVAMEYFAKWIHPNVFKDLNPEKTFEEMNKQFGHRIVSGDFGQNNFKAMQ